MFMLLFVLFIFIPIIEISLFIQVGHIVGLWPTVAMILTTAILGAILVRQQGLQTLLSLQQRMQRGELPAQEIMEGVLLAVAGILLFTPGFMTDIIGLVLLLPITRKRLAHYFMTKVKVQNMASFQSSATNEPFDYSTRQAGDTFEGEYQKCNDEDKRLDK